MSTLHISTILWRASARRHHSTAATQYRSLLAFQGRSGTIGATAAAIPRRGAFARSAVIPSTTLADFFSSTRNNNNNAARNNSIRGSNHTFLRATNTNTDTDANTDTNTAQKKKPIPTILLAGFLGSGKTSTLKHLLENNQNIKIGTIVNDVASVNIDAKLIVNNGQTNEFSSSASAVVELQNGCACCSLSDELLTSIERLTLGGTRDLDAIVVELSGVADPVAVRDNWDQAKLSSHPATVIADLQRTVTLVDACTFGTDWMTWDTAGDRDSWTEDGDDCAAVRKVPELLAEQVEAADLLLVNKIDLAGEAQVKVASGLARGLNERATVVEVEFGRVEAKELLGRLFGEEEEEVEDKKAKEEEEHSHEADASCNDPKCTDDSHSHEHSHRNHHSEENESTSCNDAKCTDESHDHSHASHDHDHGTAATSCTDPTCTDDSHGHSHSHDHSKEESSSSSSCDDPTCTDTSHSHTHDHAAKPTPSSTAADQLGISSFVYKASTPFNSQRLLALLNRWPVPIKDSLELGSLTMGMSDADDKVENKAFVGVLRSKGFCWMAPTKWTGAAGSDVWRHDTAMVS